MISLLVVNYRSAELAIDAIRSARAASSQPLQVVVVDNSCDAPEADALRAHADALLVSETNRGYAGAINDGRRACTGDVIVVTNPDVKFAANAIDALVAPLQSAGVAGPALYWDDALTWMLPPSELHTGREKFGEVLASRSRAYSESRDRARIRKRIDFWSNANTRTVEAISGAVMAIRADVFDDAGGFDERFALYFEENDFLRRVRGRIVYVPSSRVRHIYNQSAAQSDRAAALYAESEMRYLAKWNGPFIARLLKKLERERVLSGAPAPPPAQAKVRPNTLIEASPLPTFETAAGRFSNNIEIPDDVKASYKGGVLYLRVIERDTAHVLATYKMTL